MNTTETPWWTYVKDVVGGEPDAGVARRAGFDKSALTRWKQGAGVDPHFAVKFARAFGRPPIEALVKAGFLTDDEARLRTVKTGASDLDDVELARELLRRAEERATGSR